MALQKYLYPVLIALLLGSFLCFSMWAAMRAAEARPQVTDADYYSNGLKYTSTLLEKRTAEVLGWTVSVSLSGRVLVFELRDKNGQPVSSAIGSISLYLPESSSNMQFPLQETATGIYRLNLTSSMTGEMTARVEFERHGARLNRQLLLNL